ncbi:uncharacterized protein RJT21DRAFT_120722 [Scheffersomyces amazonensis]|uniref:uncharacterized protein n=1 Tax=Scheffersomyces amazonensis TaxID=1078765 RepID=UPI00315DB23E
MSWFSGNVSTVELDNKISEATSESIPNGELELSIALEITDVIRSKKIPAKQCMRALKKRLTLIYSNPNLLTSTLKLIDLCVKNSGYHFLVEIASKEFLDYLIDFIFKVHYNTKDFEVTRNESKLSVGNLILSLVKEWSIVFENQLQLNYVEKCYNQLVNEGYTFPQVNDVSHQLNSKFVDSEVPPDWVDSDSCMICYTPFSMINRKHHCRACGGVYCQTHSSNSIPLPGLGILEPVRVCDNCYAKQKSKSGKHKREESHGSLPSAPSGPVDDEEEQIRRAIELSLKDTGVQYSAPPNPPPIQSIPDPAPAVSTSNPDEEEDDEMKAAIAASLKEYEEQERIYKQRNQFQQQQQQQQPIPQQSFQQNAYEQDQSDFYNISIPTTNAPTQTSQPYPIISPSQHIEQHQTPREDLSQQEEEQINLFVTLMTNLKSDPTKQGNILYDTDLSELHAKVIKLKPKVNKSLRSSIERYEAFLEMNNKISTITRLYDQFLEAKLNLAYGNHHISQQPQQPPQNNYYTSAPRNPYGQDYSIPQQTTGYIDSQSTGYNPGIPQQTTGYSGVPEVSQQTTGYINEPVPRQSTGYPSAPYINEQVEEQEQQPQQQEIQQSSEPIEYGSVPAYPSYPPQPYSEPSEPTPVQQQPNYSYEQAGSYPTQQYEDQTNSNSNSNPNPNSNYSQPTEPDYASYPRDELNRDNNNNLSAYPSGPTEEIQNLAPPTDPFVRRQSTTLSPEEASNRFPTIETVESDYNKQTQSQTQSQSQLPSLPTMPSMPTFKDDQPTTSKPTKYVAEPEPLIDL